MGCLFLLIRHRIFCQYPLRDLWFYREAYIPYTELLLLENLNKFGVYVCAK